jgi:hypothetical protein
MKQRISVSFEIREFDRDPDEITQQVGLSPTETWEKGDILLRGTKNPKVKITARDNMWSVESGAESTESVEVHLEKLVKILAPYAAKIVPLAAKHKSMVRVAAVYDGYYPGIELSPRILAGLAALGAKVDLDIHVYSEDE